MSNNLIMKKISGENTWSFFEEGDKLVLQLLEKLGTKNFDTSRLILVNPEERSIAIKKNGLVRKIGLRENKYFVHFSDVYCSTQEKYQPETHMQVAIELPVTMMDQLLVHIMNQLFDLCK